MRLTSDCRVHPINFPSGAVGPKSFGFTWYNPRGLTVHFQGDAHAVFSPPGILSSLARPRRAPRGSAVYGVSTGGARGEPGYKQQAGVVREYRNGIHWVVNLTGSLAEGSPADGTKIHRSIHVLVQKN